MRDLIHRFLDDRSGATAVEYGVLATFLAVAITSGIGMMLDKVEWLFSSTESKLVQVMQP